MSAEVGGKEDQARLDVAGKFINDGCPSTCHPKDISVLYLDVVAKHNALLAMLLQQQV